MVLLLLLLFCGHCTRTEDTAEARSIRLEMMLRCMRHHDPQRFTTIVAYVEEPKKYLPPLKAKIDFDTLKDAVEKINKPKARL